MTMLGTQCSAGCIGGVRLQPLLWFRSDNNISVSAWRWDIFVLLNAIVLLMQALGPYARVGNVLRRSVHFPLLLKPQRKR